jgi:hypothetical protein
MQRSLKTTSTMLDISHDLPRHVRDRTTVVAPKASQLKRVVTEELDPSCTSLGFPSDRKKFKTELLSYGPSIVTADRLYDRRTPVLDRLSTRISGAMIIDPHVRKLAESAGMKVSEHAVWLMVVAVKEFSLALLTKTLCTIKAVDTGRSPPRLTRSFKGPQSTWISENDNSLKSAVPAGPLKCITSSDMHVVIANLPTSARSLSGWVSRSVFERSLNASLNSSLVLGGSAFEDVKKYIISSISPSDKSSRIETSTTILPIQVIHSGLNHGELELLKGRKSPLMRGLGRGAKDLAALKARATTIRADSDVPKNAELLPEVTAITAEATKWVDATRTPSHPTSAVPANPLAKSTLNANKESSEFASPDELPKSGEGSRLPSYSSCSILEDGRGPSSLPEQKSIASRRGKGHGVKNLAMMRARSVTSSSDVAADVATAAITVASLESNEENREDGTVGQSAGDMGENQTRDDETKATIVYKPLASADKAHELVTESAIFESTTISAPSSDEPALVDSLPNTLPESYSTIDSFPSPTLGKDVSTSKPGCDDRTLLATELPVESKPMSCEGPPSSTISVIQQPTSSAVTTAETSESSTTTNSKTPDSGDRSTSS